MAVPLTGQRVDVRLRPGFAHINTSTRRYPRRLNRDNVITGAEITVPTEVDINMHVVREQNIAQFPPEQVLGNNIGHDYANVGIGEDELVFSLRASSKPKRGRRFDPDRRQVFTGMVGHHFGPIQSQEELEDTIVFRGISAGALTWEKHRLPDPVLSVRVAGAGSTVFTGNDVIEPGEIATWSAFSYDAATRKAEMEALPDPQHYSKSKLVPILRTLRQTELVDFIGEAAAESFFDDNKVHEFGVLLKPDTVAGFDTKKQIMMSSRCHEAMTGFLHCLTAAQCGLVTLTGANNEGDLQELDRDRVLTLAKAHGLTGVDGHKLYLNYAYARSMRGVLPLGAHDQLQAASDISGLFGDNSADAGRIAQLQNISSHSLYNDTTAAYWHKRSRAVFMATTGAGPGEKVEYLLLLS